MKTVDETEIEILGEEGARLYATFGAAIEGMRLRIARDGVSTALELDGEETARLRDFLDERVPRGRATRDGSLEFEGEDASLVFYPDNMGEPYRSGLTASVRSERRGSRWIFIENRQAEMLKRFVAERAPSAAPAPGR